MAAFLTSLDIGKRACQRIGARRITSMDTTVDTSKAAAEIVSCYDKLREAELRRNNWVFATRRTVLRPVDDTTYLFSPEFYNGSTSYTIGAVVKDSNGVLWQTTVATTGQAPGLSTSPWDLYFGPMTVPTYDSGTTYFAGELVYQPTNSKTYLSLVNDNADDPPTSNWADLNTGTTTALTILWPLGSGPSDQNTTRNIFHLPANWLREAPQQPNEGSVSWLGAETGMQQTDWEYDGDYIVSATTDVIIYRFTANITGVSHFDALFCEGLACRIGMEVCEALTQSAEKIQTCVAMYKEFMGEARQVNAIESGFTMPAVDDYIACRA